MPSYTLNELAEKVEPQARRDKALIERCIDGLGFYAAQIAEEDRNSSKIEKTRTFVETLVGYWGLNDSEYYTKAKPLEDYLRVLDDRVSEARTSGAVAGDVFQTALNVIYGLYQYGEEMVVCQGADAMGDILDVSDMMKEIARAWDFESDILDSLTARLESEVRDMLGSITLPGHPVSGVVNVGYAVTQAVMFENGLSIVLAHHPDAPSPFVTWRFGVDDEGGKWYEWGHYFSTESRAKIDYISRVGDYAEQYGITERPLPTAAAEADAEQNYNMIDGVKNNEGEPKPDLTDGQTHKKLCELAPETLPEDNGEKPSVLKQIRESREASRQSPKQKPERENELQGPEL
ncbi:MAG: DUF4316 domain-containing protein [Synergistaceae bacterium]|jgi:hypothetical protein|nr:DUF4316 domain-containing protein [Synergistaceae bacterium]